MIGNKIYAFAKKLWPINRSLTGTDNRLTLKLMKKVCKNLKIKEIKTGTKVFDWKIPDEWWIKEAWIKDSNGKKILDFKKNNLHVIGYSSPVNKTISLSELKKNLYCLPKQPTAIPYVTSYYSRKWGFCASYNFKKKLRKGNYKIFINSKHFRGGLSYGEIIIPGKTIKEIFLSTYICHPSLANDNLSGIAVTTFLAKWLNEINKKLYFSYRIIFIPETIGSIAYLSKNLKKMKSNIIAGLNVSCVGDDRAFSYLPSRDSNTLADKVAKHVLKWTSPNYIKYTWLDRGSDEKHYCAPKIDLPIASIMRTKYAKYPEYHTSLDNLNTVVSAKGLNGGYEIIKKALLAFENSFSPVATTYCVPHLGRRGLYPTTSTKDSYLKARLITNYLTFADGSNFLIDIAEKCNVPIWDLYPITEKLLEHKLIVKKY